MKYIINLDAVAKNRCRRWTGNKVLINVVLKVVAYNQRLHTLYGLKVALVAEMEMCSNSEVDLSLVFSSYVFTVWRSVTIDLV